MSDCIFCKIIEGSIPSNKVYENEYCIVFDDMNAQAPIHLLVVPRRHVESLRYFEDTDTELMGTLLQACRNVAAEKGISETGYRVVANAGAMAGQTVFHFHLHVLGGRPLQWPPG